MGESQPTQSAQDVDRLFLVVAPEDSGDDIVASLEKAAGTSVVGFLVRGAGDTAEGKSVQGWLDAAGLREDLLVLTNDGRFAAVEVKLVSKSDDDAGDDAPRAQGLVELLTNLRNHVVHGPHRPRMGGGFFEPLNTLAGAGSVNSWVDLEVTAALSSLPQALKWNELTDEPTTKRSVAERDASVLDALIESTRAQLILLNRMRSANAAAHREHVELQTPRGQLEYTLPFSRRDTYDSATVGELLSPTGKTHRSIAQHRRRANELLGVKVGNQYLHPKFQIDPVRHEIRPIVAYANRALECDADPWGALDWWYSKDEALGQRRPIDMIDTGELSEKAVDFAIARASEGMD